MRTPKKTYPPRILNSPHKKRDILFPCRSCCCCCLPQATRCCRRWLPLVGQTFTCLAAKAFNINIYAQKKIKRKKNKLKKHNKHCCCACCCCCFQSAHSCLMLALNSELVLGSARRDFGCGFGQQICAKWSDKCLRIDKVNRQREREREAEAERKREQAR